MDKNCTTCVYEPDWFQNAGKCKFPLPKWAKSSTQNMIFKEAASSFPDMKCDAWTPKSTNEDRGDHDPM
ncbi:hypothetical protein SYK_02430 [Pseudodesulfovibrio nedwellii]|uniref:Uncharacterized protein n=1 Tax=Pseudodesulfovibrio nedwellii TaxID=2973072 RepID=A0ABM8AWP0_9BACT|nr:hypothetical protein [Pseudodesulfovibrio nedwellii]BDQ35883.1 hypothetical protein SYK_02430 [Pseudodesulfovibrio nedwellii]